MSDPTSPSVSALEAAFSALPQGVRGSLFSGVLHAAAPASLLHRQVLTRLLLSLAPLAGRFDALGWVVLLEPELRLGHDRFVPALAAWRRASLPNRPLGSLDVAPELVCQILATPADQKIALLEQEALARHGVSWLWQLDAGNEMVETFQLSKGRYAPRQAVGGDVKEALEPVDGLELDLGVLWRW